MSKTLLFRVRSLDTKQETLYSLKDNFLTNETANCQVGGGMDIDKARELFTFYLRAEILEEVIIFE